MKNTKKGGFTLIEILIVIGIIAVLAAIVLVAVNPAKQFADANDAQRSSNVNAILNAIGQYIVDNKGELPSGIPSGEANAAVIGDGTGEVDLCDDLVPDFMAALPADPTEDDDQSISEADCTAGGWSTGYEIYRDGNRVTITAPETEGTDEISVTR